MKSVKPNAKRPSTKVETADLDVTPIMNMFVILIPFLVSMAVFTHYSALAFGLPPNAGLGSGGPKKTDLKLTVVVRSEGFDLTIGDSVMNSVEFDLQSAFYPPLKSALESLRENLLRKNEVVIAVNDGIPFEYVVRVMDVCKHIGFEKVALAEGPNEKKEDS